MRVLVVDDSKAMRLIVSRALRQAGYDVDVVEAENGQMGLDAVAGGGIDLVLSDWNMPVMTGMEFLGALRESGSGVPFVFITTEWTPEQRERAEMAGANGLLAKPFTPDRLQEVLRTAL